MNWLILVAAYFLFTQKPAGTASDVPLILGHRPPGSVEHAAPRVDVPEHPATAIASATASSFRGTTYQGAGDYLFDDGAGGHPGGFIDTPDFFNLLIKQKGYTVVSFKTR